MPLVWVFWQVLRFLEFSWLKNTDKWSDVSQLIYDDESRSKGMDTYHGHAHAKSWGHLKMFKNKPCSTKDVRVGQNRKFESTLFSVIRQMALIFATSFYDQFKATRQVVWIFEKFCIFWRLLGEKGSINGRMCRKVQTVSEVIQTWHVCLIYPC